MSKSLFAPRVVVPLLGCFIATPLAYLNAQGPQLTINPGGSVILEPGQRPVTIHPTVEAMDQYRKQNPHSV